MTDLDRRIVRQELTIAGSNLAVAGMLSTVAVAPGWWWLAPLAALGMFLFVAASDRSRAGLRLLYAAVLAMLAIVWSVATSDSEAGLVSPALAGVSVGFAANRLLFGVVRPVPDARRRREAS